MSLVGPRPITNKEIDRYGEDYEYYRKCRPGITGLWQVSGRNNVSYGQRVAFDKNYALTYSKMIDINILLKTVKVVLLRSGAK